MTDAAMILPAGPGDATSESFPPQFRNRLRYDFGLVLHALCARGAAFERLALSMGARFVLVTIASYWQSHDEAWPSQERIATSCACSTRSVRRYVEALERAGLLRLRRTHQPNGRERIFYAPGFVLLRELALFEERYPRTRAKGLRRCSSPVDEGHETADTVSAVTPDTVSEELTDQDLEPSFSENAIDATALVVSEARESDPEEENLSLDRSTKPDQVVPILAETPSFASKRQENARSSASEAPGTSPARRQEISLDPRSIAPDAAPIVSDADRAIARVALGERMARKFPDRTLPSWFDRAEVEQVACCTLALDGDREAKLASHRAAIDAAFAASKSGPPTVKFIWGSIDHFLGHVERGSKKARTRTVATVATSLPIAASPIDRVPPSPEEVAKRNADLERLFSVTGRPSFSRFAATDAPSTP